MLQTTSHVQLHVALFPPSAPLTTGLGRYVGSCMPQAMAPANVTSKGVLAPSSVIRAPAFWLLPTGFYMVNCAVSCNLPCHQLKFCMTRNWAEPRLEDHEQAERGHQSANCMEHVAYPWQTRWVSIDSLYEASRANVTCFGACQLLGWYCITT